MPACAIDDDRSMGIVFDMGADGLEMQVHRGDVGIGKNECHPRITRRTNGSENIGAFIALIVRHAWPRSRFGPDIGQRAFLPDTRLVLEPKFNGFVFGVFRKRVLHGLGKVFLKASRASGSFSGWIGRVDTWL
jgi:hypothetical protein